MPRAAASRRALTAIDALTTTPPDTLPPGHIICRIITSAGNNIYRLLTPTDAKTEILAELPTMFRGKVWLKRGGYVVVDTGAFGERENKLGGEIVNVVRGEREWRKEGYWPKQFPKEEELEDSEESEEESTVGKMPPGSDDEE
ncbi:uncharacterized protein LAJ45_01402 [Morchella importuna]|uniref:uncharacterized protein n=1 Tax=Morchella importuna TaxID=1174673 RepID=UPI001E8CD905|nr:uncharacterized protein LAJ45_01402 [Morchella importuna]KAH8154871.1 hypothetical protein LAJ45_01402 [Morchella importuna]